MPKEVVDQAARTLKNARGSLETFLEELIGDSAGLAAQDKAWVKGSHHKTLRRAAGCSIGPPGTRR
ncbi:hypothetical protein GCM10027168_43890 [Streptomyces capparidis]